MKPFAARDRSMACLALLVSLGASPPAFAWSARGHAMVGDIATQFLTQPAARQVGELLQGDLLADGRPSGRTTLGQVASWPDELRLTPEQKATGVYHYDDVPLCAAPDYAVSCADGQCASGWFDRQLAILKDRSQSPRARNEALKWIAHLVGDVHQPLHATDHGDKGGNEVVVTWFGKRSDGAAPGRTTYNLHMAWDRLIPYRVFDDAGGYDAFLAAKPDDATRRNWQAGTFRQWVMESNDLDREFVYPALPPATSVMVRVVVSVPGATAAEVEKQLTAPLESALQAMPFVRRIGSTSRDTVSIVKVEAAAADRAATLETIRQRLMQARASWPASATVPDVAFDAADNDAGPFACDHVLTRTHDLDAAYYAPASVIVSEQLKKAGVRLARVLNDALD